MRRRHRLQPEPPHGHLPERTHLRGGGMLRRLASLRHDVLRRGIRLRAERGGSPELREALRDDPGVPRRHRRAVLQSAPRPHDAGPAPVRCLRHLHGRGDDVPLRHWRRLRHRRLYAHHHAGGSAFAPVHLHAARVQRVRRVPRGGRVPGGLLQPLRRPQQLLLRPRLHERRGVRQRAVRRLPAQQRHLPRRPAGLRAALKGAIATTATGFAHRHRASATYAASRVGAIPRGRGAQRAEVSPFPTRRCSSDGLTAPRRNPASARAGRQRV